MSKSTGMATIGETAGEMAGETARETVGQRPTSFEQASTAVVVGLNAAIVTVASQEPRTLIVRAGTTPGRSTAQSDTWDALPFGPFDPLSHRTMEAGLRAWVRDQTGLELGYVEQLYTFGDRGRNRRADDTGPHIISVGYLALIRAQGVSSVASARASAWRGWYAYFPWEDWRSARPPIIDATIAPLVKDWVAAAPSPALKAEREQRLNLCFGLGGIAWDEEKVLERFELLYEAGLVDEAARDGRKNARRKLALPESKQDVAALGEPMQHDHRRILATAIGRLRAKLKYRPVVFELMTDAFTLTELQRMVEAIMGGRLHKQNFRRLVEKGGLVEGTGQMTTKTGGRPAEQFRFRPEVVTERAAPGVRVSTRTPR